MTPDIADDAFVAPNATVIGDVTVGAQASLWYNVVIRGDVEPIRIGARSNIQDGSVVHVTGDRFPTAIGDDVLVGHLAMIHGCELQDRCFIGMKACVLDGAVVESGAMVAAGALVGPGKVVRAGELWGGMPARKLRDLKPEEVAGFQEAVDHYVELAVLHRREIEG
jgi:carbonic anhydrase/acetyltransferase-like protein (isoleucine patch superfamily)